MVFNPAPFYHLRNADLSGIMLVLAGFISLWHMPLFFLLAGWSAHASLTTRGTAGFVKERIFKLWVPLCMGCVLLMPPIKYIELRGGLDANYAGLRVSPALQQSFVQIIPSGLPTLPPFDESFVQFLPTFFTRLERFTWAHLWFIAYLLVFTMACLPLFRSLCARCGDLVWAPRWWLCLPIAPLALVQVFLRPYWPGLQNLYDDWANVGYYSTYLIAGFLLARYPALERTVHREWGRALHGDCNRTDFVDVNPRAEVPALVDGDCSLYDSTVICEYLEDRHPVPPLYPQEPQLRATCRLIEDLADTQLDAALYAIAIVEMGRREQFPDMRAAAARDLERLYGELERALGEAWFLCGSYSLADIAVYPHLMAANFLGFPIETARHPRLSRWMEEVQVRPAIVRDNADVVGTLQRLQEEQRSAFDPYRVQWRSDRLEWVIKNGFAEWLFDEMRAGRAFFPLPVRA